MQPSVKKALSITVCIAAMVCLASLGVASLQAPSQQGPDASQPQAAGDLALPERVVLPDERVEDSAIVGLNGGSAIDQAGSRLDGAYDRYLLEARLEGANDDEERREILQETVSEINTSTNRLHQREREVRSDFRSGSIDVEAYLATLVSIDSEAEQLESLLQVIDPIDPRSDGLSDQYSAANASREIARIRGDILVHRGPIRAQIGEMMAGEQPPSRVHVASGRNGFVIATIADGEYHREAIRKDLLVSGREQGISLNDAFNLAEGQLYPRYRASFTSVGLGVDGQFYRLLGEGGSTYDNGYLRSYIDAVSQSVFWEYQRIGLEEDLPRASPVTNDSDTLTVTVRPTYESGPASVKVTNEGSPVEGATVTVDGEPVTETDEDGTAWLILPKDEPTVSVAINGNAANVVIQWEEVYD